MFFGICSFSPQSVLVQCPFDAFFVRETTGWELAGAINAAGYLG
ncbi:MAG TPA: hypothetical protein VLA19_27745 [Herpetosiphonaceae bacterium]|nr:hypothetical protein [Herpetosiphonaceae bacterium]